MKIFHGNIITCDKDNNVFNYLVEDKQRIVYTGNNVPGSYGGIKQIELGERALLPSFGDGHLHFSNWALFAASFFDVRAAGNISEIGAMVKDFVVRNKKSKLVLCFGASKHSVAEKRLITRQEIDQFCADRPVVIICYDGHSLIANSYLVNKFPERIKKMRGFNADTGQLFHEAYYAGVDFATSLVSPLTLVKSMIASYDLLAEQGFGMIHPVEGIGFPLDLDVVLVSLVARAKTRKTGFQTRLFFQTMEEKKVLRRKLPRIGGCFATALDGCFGACDAALSEPYTHHPDNSGILFHADDEMIDFAKRANKAGLQMEFHAIGDAAVHQAVASLEGALKDFPRRDHRHTIIHACLLSPEDLRICAELDIGITLQPGVLISPLEPVEYLKEILGPRVKSSSPLKDIVASGIHLSSGSDAPVTNPDPIEAIYAACNHPYDPGQSLSIQEALKMATYEVAWTSFDEKERGSLETGKFADMVVLNQNPLEMDPKDLLDLRVEQLYRSGKIYKPGMSIPGMIWNALLTSKKRI